MIDFMRQKAEITQRVLEQKPYLVTFTCPLPYDPFDSTK